MKNPAVSLLVEKRKPVFWSLFLLTLAIMAVLNLVDQPLITPAAPFGIVSFELAGNDTRAQAILASWDETARLHAAFSLGLDYLFMPAYALTIGLGAWWAGDALKKKRWPLAGLGMPIAAGQALAALFDGVENLGLALILLAGSGAPWAALARGCALAKFGLIFLGLVYAFLGLSAYLVGFLVREP